MQRHPAGVRRQIVVNQPVRSGRAVREMWPFMNNVTDAAPVRVFESGSAPSSESGAIDIEAIHLLLSLRGTEQELTHIPAILNNAGLMRDRRSETILDCGARLYDQDDSACAPSDTPDHRLHLQMSTYLMEITK